MTIQRRVLDKIALCRARLAANNTFTISSKDLEGSEVEKGDDVRVRVTKSGLGGEIRPRDSDIFDTTVQKTGQVHVPKSTREKLDLETGDILQYVVVPKDAFPGIQDGPLRSKARGAAGATEEEMEEQRPERQTTSASFSNKSMQKTGQVTIPADVMERMGLVQGDTVLVTVMWQGQDTTFNADIGTSNRIVIPKAEREKLGLEPGDQPQIRLAVFD